jgi:hypothetical protein
VTGFELDFSLTRVGVNKPNKTCVDCPALKTFLLSPSQSRHAFRFTQQRRTHLESALSHFNRHQAMGFGFFLRSRRPDDSSLDVYKFTLPKDFGGEGGRGEVANHQQHSLRDSTSVASLSSSSSNSISNTPTLSTNSHSNNYNSSGKNSSSLNLTPTSSNNNNHSNLYNSSNSNSKNPLSSSTSQILNPNSNNSVHSQSPSTTLLANPCDPTRAHISACQMMRCVMEAHKQQRQAREERERARERRRREAEEEKEVQEEKEVAVAVVRERRSEEMMMNDSAPNSAVEVIELPLKASREEIADTMDSFVSDFDDIKSIDVVDMRATETPTTMTIASATTLQSKSDVIYIIGDEEIGDMEIFANFDLQSTCINNGVDQNQFSPPLNLIAPIESLKMDKILSKPKFSTESARMKDHNVSATLPNVAPKPKQQQQQHEWKNRVKDVQKEKEARREKERSERSEKKEIKISDSQSSPTVIDMDFYMEKEYVKQKRDENLKSSHHNNFIDNNRHNSFIPPSNNNNSSNSTNTTKSSNLNNTVSSTSNNSNDGVSRKQIYGKVNIDIFGPQLPKLTKRSEQSIDSNDNNSKRPHSSQSSSQKEQNALNNSKETINVEERGMCCCAVCLVLYFCIGFFFFLSWLVIACGCLFYLYLFICMST